METENYIKWENQNDFRNFAGFEDSSLHAEYLKPILIRGMDRFLQGCLEGEIIVFENLFAAFWEEKIDEAIKTKKKISDISKEGLNLKDQFDLAWRRYCYKLLTCQVNESPNEISILRMVEILFQIVKESFADLVSILILDINYEKYYPAILKSCSLCTIDDIVNSDAIIRMALVTETMCSEVELVDDVREARWKINDIKKCFNEMESNDGEKAIYEKMLHYHDKLTKCKGAHDDLTRIKEAEKISLVDVFADGELLKFLMDYLMTCRAQFEKDEKNAENDLLKKIRDDYMMIEKNNPISERIKCFNKCIDEYRKDTFENAKNI